MNSHATCASCGCTDLRACQGGCSWLAVNRNDGTGVCSRCPKSLTAWRNQQAVQERGRVGPDTTQAELIQIGPTDI